MQPLPVFPKFLTTPNRNCVFSEFSDGPVFRTPCFQLLWVDLGLIPGRGTNKIPQAALHGQKICFKKKLWDFPGGPVVKTPRFHCRGHRFDPWSPSQGSSTCCAVLSKRKETVLWPSEEVNWGKLEKMSLFSNSRGVPIWDKQTVVSYRWIWSKFRKGYIYGQGM